MVDFEKRLGAKRVKRIPDPLTLYEGLDRESDKGELRNAQREILKRWYENYRNKSDVIIKLHTGQGKTLIGLLILQSKLNQGAKRALYLCPNKFLVNQTCIQAKQFGIKFCTAEDDLPVEFLDSEAILITSVQKLFNGLTKFGTGGKSEPVDCLVLDDAHACIDSIRDSVMIRIPENAQPYALLRDLFSTVLQEQGLGTHAEIVEKNAEAFLPVPYWEWEDKATEVVQILARHHRIDSIRFAWPILKDIIPNCRCVISGAHVEIAPYLPPVREFGSYANAKHRVFMSATVTNDSFLIKGLRLDSDTIRNPLLFEQEKWSGEKMILLPSFIDPSLDRSSIVKKFGPVANRRFGVVALVPGFYFSRDWQGYGATVATTTTIDEEIQKLKDGVFDHALVMANRYDGLDLPDNQCRILILDSKPHSDRLIDRYIESCRPNSRTTMIQTARRIEQGLGRGVRGEKDYCVIIIIGAELVKSVRSKESREFLSSQTQAQINIGLEVAKMAAEEIEGGKKADVVLEELVGQSLSRDETWKAFYVEQMNEVKISQADPVGLEIFQLELAAEECFEHGKVAEAIQNIQEIIHGQNVDLQDKGWYLQEMARYKLKVSKVDADNLQREAHTTNHALLKPRTGFEIKKLAIVSQKRVENITNWIKGHSTREELQMHIEDILSALQFGVRAERFEYAMNELAMALGFVGERPEKEWKEGPDNLWALRDNEYLIIECKSEVKLTRAEIFKREAEQMNQSWAWFTKNYPGSKAVKIMVIPTRKLSRDANFLCDVFIMDEHRLGQLRTNVKSFFREFAISDFSSLSATRIQELVEAHKLSVTSITGSYGASVLFASN